MKTFKFPGGNKRGRVSLIIYVAAVVGVMLLLNLVLLPMMQNARIADASYSDFLYMLDRNEVAVAEVYDTYVLFAARDDAAPEGYGQIYRATRMSDPDLVNRLLEAGVPDFDAVHEEQSMFVTVLSWILPIVVMMGLWFIIMRFLAKKMGDGAGSAMSFGKNTAKIYGEESTGKTFADVAGQDEAKDSLQELVEFLKNPGKYSEIGARLPKGALLVGPPGTGKTLLAKAVAGEAHVPFFAITGSEFVEMFVGVGASRVRDLFKQALEKAPCIVFIDEIDAIGKSRNSGQYGGNDEREQTLNQLLSEMDGFDSSKGVIILAATNRPEVLDPALLRPGRFDRRIVVDMPDLAGREAILRVHARAVKMGSDTDLKTIAKQTSGVSGAELANIVNEAAINAVRCGRKVVEQRDLLFAVDLVIAGAEKKSAALSDREKQLVAYHEIGHALVAVKNGNKTPVQKITIVPRTMGALGFTMQSPEEDRYLLMRDEVLDQIRTLLGGRSAEEVKFGTVSSGASNDIEKATTLARNMVTRYGMSERFDMMGLSTAINPYLGEDTAMQCSNETATIVDEEVLAIIKRCHEEARAVISKDIRLLDLLANALLERETMSGEEFSVIIADYEFSKHQLPDSTTHETVTDEDTVPGAAEQSPASSGEGESEEGPSENTEAGM